MTSDVIEKAFAEAGDAHEVARRLLAVNEALLRTVSNLYDFLAETHNGHYPEDFTRSIVGGQQANYAARKRLIELAE